MPCRVGITTNPVNRKADWETKVIQLKNWKILASYNSVKKAREHEDRYAERYGCQSSHSGIDNKGPWHVYRFEYLRKR